MNNILSPKITSGELIVGLLIVVIAGAAVWYVVARLKQAYRRFVFGVAREKIHESWKDVENLMARGDEMSARLAVMHADAVVDQALQIKHFPGDRFKVRLDFAIHKYKSLKSVWPAHRLRNELAHDPHRSLKMNEARRAIAKFRKALEDLGAL